LYLKLKLKEKIDSIERYKDIKLAYGDTLFNRT